MMITIARIKQDPMFSSEHQGNPSNKNSKQHWSLVHQNVFSSPCLWCLFIKLFLITKLCVFFKQVSIANLRCPAKKMCQLVSRYVMSIEIAHINGLKYSFFIGKNGKTNFTSLRNPHIVYGKNHGFRLRLSFKPIQTHIHSVDISVLSHDFPLGLHGRKKKKQWHSTLKQFPVCID